MQEEVAAVADDREVAVEMYYQIVRAAFYRGRGGGAAGVTTVTHGWRRPAAGSDRNSRNIDGYAAFLFCLVFRSIGCT